MWDQTAVLFCWQAVFSGNFPAPALWLTGDQLLSARGRWWSSPRRGPLSPRTPPPRRPRRAGPGPSPARVHGPHSLGALAAEPLVTGDQEELWRWKVVGSCGFYFGSFCAVSLMFALIAGILSKHLDLKPRFISFSIPDINHLLGVKETKKA